MSQPFRVSPIEEIKAVMLVELTKSIGSNAIELLPELIPMLLEDAPDLLHDLSGAVQANDYHGVNEIAHTLKGSCASLGIVNLAKICQEIENMGKINDLSTAPTRLNDAFAEYEQVKLALKSYI